VILLLSSDLMFQSRISGAARTANRIFVSDRSVQKLIERVSAPDQVALILIDLTLSSLQLPLEIPLLKQTFANGKVMAYGPHVDVERLQLAQESGADVVLTRGQMDRDLVEIIAGA
jgi:hypothetical protein